jgi:hypothetical protein
MQLKGKALFNLLRINWLEDCNSEVKKWQVEDLRELGIEELFSRLKKLGLILDEEGFFLYAENCLSPEELVDYIWIEPEELEGRDQTYLLLFELWRRLLPDLLCLSIFCDELDHLIDFYDKEELEDEGVLQKALSTLEDVLDDACDREGGECQKIFAEVASHCAHDLEQFIYDYISDQIVEKNETYASELIDAFYDYVEDHRRCDLLRAQLLALFDIEESNIIYGRILEELREEPNLELVLLVAESLVHHGDVHLFMQAIKQALPLLKKEDEFQNLLTMVAEYYRCLDRDEEAKMINGLLEDRSAHPPNALVEASDKAIGRISHLISLHLPNS